MCYASNISLSLSLSLSMVTHLFCGALPVYVVVGAVPGQRRRTHRQAPGLLGLVIGRDPGHGGLVTAGDVVLGHDLVDGNPAGGQALVGGKKRLVEAFH